MLEKWQPRWAPSVYDIKNRGYTGSRSNLERLLKVWREVENLQPDEPPPDMDVSEPVRDPDTGHMISSVVAAALCIKPRGLLTDRQAGRPVTSPGSGTVC